MTTDINIRCSPDHLAFVGHESQGAIITHDKQYLPFKFLLGTYGACLRYLHCNRVEMVSLEGIDLVDFTQDSSIPSIND